MRNKIKLVEKLRNVPTTLPICQLLTILDYQTGYEIKVQSEEFYSIILYAIDLI